MILSPSSQIHVVPLLPEYAAQAAFWATRLHLPLLPQPSPHPAEHRRAAPSSSRLVGPVEAAGMQMLAGPEGLDRNALLAQARREKPAGKPPRQQRQLYRLLHETLIEDWQPATAPQADDEPA